MMHITPPVKPALVLAEGLSSAGFGAGEYLDLPRLWVTTLSSRPF